MSKVIKKAVPIERIQVECGFCRSTIEYHVDELRWVSDHPPYHGLQCPNCNKTIFRDGSRN